jgi:hypothetical protein
MNWKTTSAGTAAIVAAGAQIIYMFASGMIDPNILLTDIGILSAGISGIFAKDWNVTGGSVKQ